MVLRRAIARATAPAPTSAISRFFSAFSTSSSLCAPTRTPLRSLQSLRPLFLRPFSMTSARLHSSPAASTTPSSSTSSSTSSASSASTSPSTAASPTPKTNTDPLKEVYKSDNPAQWVTWSSDDFYKRHAGTKPRGRQMQLIPKTGRTVFVTGNVDVNRAFMLVSVLCRRNNISQDAREQKYHERIGLKRKRRRFEHGKRVFDQRFKATVGRVQELAHQGW